MARGNNFDALRLLGALTVLVGHQFPLMGLDQPTFAGYYMGILAVFVFFAVSGYLVAGSWQNDPNGFRFLSRRFLRMAPGWTVLMVLTLIAYVAGYGSFPNNPYPWFNGSLWTLEWEILCYAVLGVSALLAPLRIVAPVIFVSLLVIRAKTHEQVFAELGLMFCAGVLLRAYPLQWKVISASVLAGAVAALLMWEWYFYAILLIIPTLSIAFGNASWPGVRSAGRFGDLSYGIYIYAFPVQQFGVMLLGKDQPYFPMLAISIAVTGILAALSWHFVESPALRLKPHKPAAAANASRSPAVSTVSKMAVSEK